MARPPVKSLPLFLAAGLAAVAPKAQADAESDYDNTCAACHNLGVAGAPRLGDHAAWKDRIARGHDLLHDHAIHGYTGSRGVMPPKGGFTHLTDNEVKAIVEYMILQASRAEAD